eukprot:scaffold15117_cov59-Phaeocystis_antarctica.AAC.4
MDRRRPFGLATIGILLAILYAQAQFKSHLRAVARGPAQESLLVLLPDHADHADHAAGLHRTIIQGVLVPPPLPGSAHHDQQWGSRPDDVIVFYSDSGAACTAQGCSCRGKPAVLQLAAACCSLAVLIALLGAALLLYIAAMYCHAERRARVLVHTDERTLGLAALRFRVLFRCTIPAVAGRCAGHGKLLGVGKQTPIRSAFKDC